MKSLLIAEITDCYIVGDGVQCPYYQFLKREEGGPIFKCLMDDHKVSAKGEMPDVLYKDCPLPRVTPQ